DGGEWGGRSLAALRAVACAWSGGVGVGFGRAAAGKSLRHKVTIHAISHHMLALIRRQAAPG
ncbi:hypothetical protein D8B23_21320, partial [Verminephrobacter aporrectodeae subsp. tuberculatae]|uniref:hypothetical protein n=1 Tax=Verminephrobacter aporrectodeae TaxID=1110389 RepID=UPI0022447D4A